MGFWQSKNQRTLDQSASVKPKTLDPEELVINRIRKTLSQDLETFLLNNILLSVQFFENFER
jgi:hypothetical protein